MAERRVWIAQCLCPQRHAIVGDAGEADDEAEAMRELGEPLHNVITAKLIEGMNPWCAICGARQETWRIEVGRTRFRTIAEARPALLEAARQQLLTNLILGSHGPTPPGRA